jgi:hypothetical protein
MSHNHRIAGDPHYPDRDSTVGIARTGERIAKASKLSMLASCTPLAHTWTSGNHRDACHGRALS